jgi:hypothetical protein
MDPAVQLELQPLGVRLDPSAGNAPELTIGADGTVYAWDYKTVMAYRSDGTPLAGWPYQIPDIERVMPFAAGVHAESQLSTDSATGCTSYVMTLIATPGAIGSTWPVGAMRTPWARTGPSARKRTTRSWPFRVTERSNPAGP